MHSESVNGANPPTVDPVTAYARSVAKKEIVAGPYVRAACERHLNDLASGAERGLRFDVDAVAKVIRFFRALTIEVEERQADGSVKSKVAPFELQPWQVFIVGSLFGWKNADGLRRFRRAYIEAAKGCGKALALDTPIPTPSGWRDMRALQPGDAVFDELGRPCWVTAVTPEMVGRPCFEVVFDDGARIVADAEHLWLTDKRRESSDNGATKRGIPKAQWGKWRIALRTTAQIAETLRYPNGRYQSANHSVALCGALELPPQDLPVPPYTLGAWLGDGDSDSARLTVSIDDWEIVDSIAADGVPWSEQKRHAPHICRVSLSEGMGTNPPNSVAAAVMAEAVDGKPFNVPVLAASVDRDRGRVAEFVSQSGYFDRLSRVCGVGDGGGMIPAVWKLKAGATAAAAKIANPQRPVGVRLRTMGLLGNKHIPPQYLRGSMAQRLALLQGLMDTDGTIGVNGVCEFLVMNERLALGFRELVHSLGMKTTLQTGRATIYGRDVGQKWRVQFSAPHDLPMFRLKRKLARQFKRHARRRLSGERRIVECRPVASVPVKCISVDSPSRMYLAGREMVPTHNSPLAAGIGHYFLCGKGIIKERGEVYSAATSREQATILFRDAIAMWRRSPGLRKRLTTKGKQTQTISQLTHIKTDSIFRPVSAENKGQSGLRPYCALIDEVHEHSDNTVIEMMRAGTKGNQEALIFEITNAGFDKRSVCGQEHDYSVQVVTGEVQNDAWFAFICSLDEGDEPFEDESCWPKANPNLGVSIHPAYIREQVAEAKGMPSKEGTVRRLNFCQWTDSENQAIPRELWEACEGEVDPDAMHAAGYRCHGGLDLSRVGDLTAFTLNWLVDETKDKWKFAAKTWFWTPKDTLAERSKKDRSPYDVWAKQGHLEAVPGKLIKFPWVAAALLELCAKYHPETIGCDQYGLTQLLDQLGDTGSALPCVVHPQGFQKRVIGERDGQKNTGAEEIILWMPDSINKLEAALLEKRITVDINPVMRMCSQAVVYTMNRTGHRMFDKEKATRRIDGMVSLAMSIGVATSTSTAIDLDEFLANAVMR